MLTNLFFFIRNVIGEIPIIQKKTTQKEWFLIILKEIKLI